MALAATTIWEVETTGDDTNNGGAFDPGQTAGMFTDGAATSATGASPVFTSASYNFVAGDVGAWVFIASGTNWIPGWYKVASVASNAATLSAAIGMAVVSAGGASITAGIKPSVVIGCATTASPTGATWSIDYSQQSATRYTYTDLVSAGAGLTVSSVLKPFAKEQVGNSLVITGGTNFTTGRYVIASVAAGVATVVGPGNITTGVGAAGTGGQGGALASPGQVGAHLVASNQTFIQTGTYTVTSASTNISGGCLSVSVNLLLFEGYATVRGDLYPIGASGTRPTIIASGISTFVLINRTSGSFSQCRNLILDGASLTSSRGYLGSSGSVINVLFKNFTNSGLGPGSDSAFRCAATGCSTAAAFASSGVHRACVAYSNTFTGFGGTGPHSFCIAYANSGGSSNGFAGSHLENCVSYGNGQHGFAPTGSAYNCVAENNGAYGFSLGSAQLVQCAAYNNTSGAVLDGGTVLAFPPLGFITGTASFFTNPGSGDFSLNTSAGGGALLRATGYPGVFPVGLTTGYLDVGAAQHADPPSGSAGIIGDGATW